MDHLQWRNINMALKQTNLLLAALHTYFQMRNCHKDKSILLITEYSMQIKKGYAMCNLLEILNPMK